MREDMARCLQKAASLDKGKGFCGEGRKGRETTQKASHDKKPNDGRNIRCRRGPREHSTNQKAAKTLATSVPNGIQAAKGLSA